VIGQGRSTLHFEQAMERTASIILNCAKGIIGETRPFHRCPRARARAGSRDGARSIEPHERRPFHIVIDEAQNFGPEVIASLVTEARKVRLSVVICTQYYRASTQAAAMRS